MNIRLVIFIDKKQLWRITIRKLTINESASTYMIEDAANLFKAIDERLDVKANKAWNRVSISYGQSLYFVKRADGKHIIHLNGNNIKRFGDYAFYHWGNARSTYHVPNNEHEITWLIDFEVFSSTVEAVFNKQYQLPNDSIIENKLMISMLTLNYLHMKNQS